MAGSDDHVRLIAPPPVFVLLALLGGAVAHVAWPARLAPGLVLQWPSLGFYALALALTVAALVTLHRARTAILPHHATKALVTSGPYRFTRNPIYLGMGLLLAGTALLANSVALLLVIIPWAVVMRWGVIAREERYLEGKFGDDYRAYCRRVRRWL